MYGTEFDDMLVGLGSSLEVFSSRVSSSMQLNFSVSVVAVGFPRLNTLDMILLLTLCAAVEAWRRLLRISLSSLSVLFDSAVDPIVDL